MVPMGFGSLGGSSICSRGVADGAEWFARPAMDLRGFAPPYMKVIRLEPLLKRYGWERGFPASLNVPPVRCHVISQSSVRCCRADSVFSGVPGAHRAYSMGLITLRVLDGADQGQVFLNLLTPVTIGREEGDMVRTER